MVGDAEKYAAEDEKQRQRVTAKNGLESYVFSVKQTLENQSSASAAAKIDAEDKKKIESKGEECLKWLDANQLAETEEFEAMRKELEAIVNPVFTKLHRGNGKGQNGQNDGDQDRSNYGSNYDGPTVEEVD